MPIPVSFTIAVVLTIALFIFFGAWAVSADAEGYQRTLSFAVVGPGAALQAESGTPTSTSSLASANPGESNADTWWGQSFLKACPLH
jgi:hypothetical protein